MEVNESSAQYAASQSVMSEVGEIPADWSVQSLGEICTIRAGGDVDRRRYSTSESPSHPYPIWANARSKIPYGYSSNPECPGGSLTVTARGDIGHAAFRDRPYCAVGRLLSLVPSKSVSGYYLAEYINARVRFATESTGVPQLTGPQIASYKVAVPARPGEAHAIAEALSDADALIESLSLLLAKKRQIKQGAMQELLTGKKRLPGFSGKWESKVLGQSATLKARIGWQGLTTKEYLSAGDFYLVTGTELRGGAIDWDECSHVEATRYKQDPNIQLVIDDVLVTKDGTIGKVGIVTSLPKPATLNSGIFVVRPLGKTFYPGFFYYLLCSSAFTEFLDQLAAGSTISHLYQKDFVAFSFQLPPTEGEQKAIASVLADMDSDIAMVERRLWKTRGVKQGMMQALLTGRIRLPASNIVPLPTKPAANLPSIAECQTLFGG